MAASCTRTRTRTGAVLAVGALVALVTGCATSTPAVHRTSPVPTVSASPSQPLLATDDPHTVVGGLAPGFPTALLPVPAGASVLVSSADPGANGTVQVSLNVRSDQDAAGLLAAVSAPLLAAGFTTGTPPADAGLAAQATFSRSDGAELLVVGVRDDGSTRTLSVGGTVKTG